MNSFLKQVKAIHSYFLSTEGHLYDENLMAKDFLVSVYLVASVVAFSFSIYYFSIGDYSSLLFPLLTLGSMLTFLFVVKLSQSIRLAAIIFNTAFLVIIPMRLYEIGFLNSPQVNWLLVLPFFNTLTIGIRFGWITTFGAIAIHAFIANFTSVANMDSVTGLSMPNGSINETLLFSIKILVFMMIAQIYERNRKRLISELNLSQDFLKKTNSMAKIGGWSYDPQKNKIWWSDETYRIHDVELGTDVPVEEAINFYAEEAKPIITEALRLAIENKESWDLELPFLTSKGKKIWVHTIGAPVKVGRDYVIRGTFQDITERKKHEAELQKSRDEALRALEVKSKFLANISHEIRTPMHGISGNAELLLESNLEDKERKRVLDIQTSSLMLEALVADILDFGDLEKGTFKLERKPFQMKNLVESVRSTFSWVADESLLNFHVKAKGSLDEWLSGDELRLTQVIFNLIKNGIKFTQSGDVTFTVESIPGQQGCYRFEVQDTGKGIPKEEIRELFTSFFQGDDNLSRQHEGAGLGLSISNGILNLMGSELHVKSTLGEGSVFWFEVKFSRGFIPFYAPKREMKKANEGNASCNVLVVDDNEVNLSVAKAFLKRQDCTIEIARGGEEAIRRAESQDFDIIFMDIHMPEVDGISATKTILEHKPAQVIVALTASATENNRKDYYKAGMLEVLGKPFKPQDLTYVIKKFCS